jgi:hypothetical protein
MLPSSSIFKENRGPRTLKYNSKGLTRRIDHLIGLRPVTSNILREVVKQSAYFTVRYSDTRFFASSMVAPST